MRVGTMALGWGISTISAYLAIDFLLEFINPETMAPSAVYRTYPGFALFALFQS
jgi:undecaprenyl pyrophosphate phosphatase UppP